MTYVALDLVHVRDLSLRRIRVRRMCVEQIWLD